MGIGKLRAAGIVVEMGLMRDAARELNIGFFSRLERGRPWLRVKLAMSLDGRTALADGRSQWITGEAARNDVQRWRARSSAIVTGTGTALADDPRLTVRSMEEGAFAPPLRVLFDSQLRVPTDKYLFDGRAPTLVLHGIGTQAAKHAGVEYVAVKEREGRIDPGAALAVLASRHCNEVLVEAGASLCGALFAAGLVDELLLYIAPVLLGDTARPLLELPPLVDMAARWKLTTLDRKIFGEDLRLRLRPATP